MTPLAGILFKTSFLGLQLDITISFRAKCVEVQFMETNPETGNISWEGHIAGNGASIS